MVVNGSNGERESLERRIDREMARSVLADLQRQPPPPPLRADGVVRASLDSGLPRQPARRASQGASASSSGTSPSDLNSSLITRLTKLEKEWKIACGAIQRKDKALAQLAAQFEDFRALHAECKVSGGPPEPPPPEVPPEAQEQIDHLKKENARLKRQLKLAWGQVGDMKLFLNDYGMVWVGTPNQEDDYQAQLAEEQATTTHSQASEAMEVMTEEEYLRDRPPRYVEHPPGRDVASMAHGKPGRSGMSKDDHKHVGNKPPLPPSAGGSSSGTSGTEFEVNMAQLMESVAELNALAGDGKGEVVRGAGGETRLKMPDAMRLALFKDGFQLRGGQLRSYKQSANRAFIKDIMDGYFPYELKDEFPEGVPFEVIDKTSVQFAQAFQPFSGAGNQLSGGGNVHSLSSVAGAQAPLRADEYLRKLPNAVIRNGKVINVRSDLEAMLKGSSCEAPEQAMIDTTATDALMAGNRPGSRGATSEQPLVDSGSITTLRVKAENGSSTYILKMRADNTVGELRTHIDRHRGSCGSYEIRSNFPVRVYNDPAQTLQDAGLVPNAALHLKSM